MNSTQIIQGIHKYVSMHINTITNGNPMLAFVKPLLVRIADNYIDKLALPLSLLADKDGNIDIQSLLSDMTHSLLVAEPFTLDTSFIGPIYIGNGTISFNIPYINKQLVFNASDVDKLKEILTTNN